MNIKKAVSGAALAIAAATMFAGVATQAQAADANVHCYGVTSCKGQAVCKGHGFKAMTKAACDAAGGKVGE